MLHSFSHFLIFFGGSMSCTLAIGQLMERDRRFFNYMFAAFLFCVGICQYYSGLIVTGMLPQYPYLGFLHLPFLCLAGPACYLSFKSVFWRNFKLRKKDALHSMSVIIVIILIIPLVAADETTKMIVMQNPPSFRSGNFMQTYYSIVIVKVVLDGVGYVIAFLKECSFLLDINYIRKNKIPPILLAIIVLLSFASFLYCISVFINNFVSNAELFYHAIIEGLSVVLLFTVLLIYYMSTGHENYFRALRSEEEKSRYEKSRIRNIDLSDVLGRLDYLIEKEKVFIDDSISLNRLAELLAIEPYQLSQIINEKYNKNFNSFINTYRIEEARRLLLHDPEATIINIVYAVGFNSSAPFYEWFQKLTGESPSKFKKRHAPKNI